MSFSSGGNQGASFLGQQHVPFWCSINNLIVYLQKDSKIKILGNQNDAKKWNF